MKIVVAYKWAANPQQAQVSAQGAVDWGRAKASFGEYDAVAAELARRLADETVAEVIGLSVGPASIAVPLATKGALSRGLDQLVLVTDDSLADADSARTAAVLAAAVRHIGDVDLVLAGDSSVDVAARMVPALLAARLSWPVLLEAGAVGVEGENLTVERVVPSGRQRLRVQLPAVVAVAPDAAVARVPGMKDILAAGKKPVTVLAPGDVEGLDEGGDGLASRERRRPEKSARAGRLIDASDPSAAARELVAALRGDHVL